jgi:hypothetical protein
MKKYRSIWLVALFFGLILSGMLVHTVRAMNLGRMQKSMSVLNAQPIFTESSAISPTEEVNETPEKRELPPVGSNAGLVLGASVLVLIIIGGVMFSSRRRQKH